MSLSRDSIYIYQHNNPKLGCAHGTQSALTKEEMKNCVWLKPELVAQIVFTKWIPDGQLRHSKFVGLREDKEAREVVWEGRV